jgi:spore germination cell wall hydrolase CwlJ-like protein
MNIYHEARGEPLAGQIAVALVVQNRVNSPKFPNSICAVVHQGHYWEGHPIRNKCAFSWWCDGKSDMPQDDQAWQQALHLAYRVQNTDVIDITEGATFYHADYVQPYWAGDYAATVKLGQHIFYR